MFYLKKFLLILISFFITCSSNAHENLLNSNLGLGDRIILGIFGTSPIDTEVKQAKQLLKEGKIRGILLFRDNITSPRQLKRLTAFLKTGTRKDIIIAVDQEGGKIMRLRADNGFNLPMKAAAEYTSEAEIYQSFFTQGKILSAMGINLDFAPVLDVNINPTSPAIGKLGRSFSRDPKIVTSYGSQVIKGLKDAGVDSCGKHFPGHGSAIGDTHEEFVDVTNSWNKEDELFPFIALQDQLPYIMVAHVFNKNLDPELPASISPKIYRMLPNYKGKFITDCYFMKAVADKYQEHEFARKAIDAGADLIIFGRSKISLERLKKPILPLDVFVKKLHKDFNDNDNCCDH